MFNELIMRLGLREPSATRRLHQELQAIGLQLVLRNQQITRLYKEMDLLRDAEAELKCKLDQLRGEKPQTLKEALVAQQHVHSSKAMN
jgi:hypothetical protein